MMPKTRGAGIVLIALVCLGIAAGFGAHVKTDSITVNPGSMRSDAPPGVRFVTVALGGFRGLLADVLWVHASELQEKGRFFEVAQLSDWITRLEPRYAEVWVYHAWNLAYNITAVVPDPADRWHWVKNGIQMLRDEGIPSNPDEPKLYWELGWMYYDKVGGHWDEATLYYRVSWALEMMERLGGGMVNYTAIATHPEAAQAFAAAGLKLEVMRSMDADYGPFDWRLPETHAVYWGLMGHQYQKPDSPWCDRLVWMGLTETVKAGRLEFQPQHKIYQQGPRLDIAIKGIRRCASATSAKDPLVGLAVSRFLRESAVYLYAFGLTADAQSALTALKRIPEGSDAVMPLEDFVRREVGYVTLLSPESKLDRVVVLLAQSDIWARLQVAANKEGFARLARLYWEALVKDDPKMPDWDTMTRLGRERSLREMPVTSH